MILYLNMTKYWWLFEIPVKIFCIIFLLQRKVLEIVFNILITRNVLKLNSHKIQTFNCERGEVWNGSQSDGINFFVPYLYVWYSTWNVALIICIPRFSSNITWLQILCFHLQIFHILHIMINQKMCLYAGSNLFCCICLK